MLILEFSKGMKIVWIIHISYKFIKKNKKEDRGGRNTVLLRSSIKSKITSRNDRT